MTRLLSNNEISAKGNYSELDSIRQYIRSHAIDSGLSKKQIDNIILAVDEACANLIRYNMDFDQNKTIQIDVLDSKLNFTVEISDSGKPFNPLENPDPNMKQYFKEFKKGGLGIKIMKNVVDKIEYIKKDSANKRNSLKLIVYK